MRTGQDASWITRWHTLPSFSALKGNSRQKAAADLVRARLADARAKAMEDGQPYMVTELLKHPE